ncbi:gamma-glutamyltransferase, partial [Oleiphilus sp. HI0125]
SPGGSRIINYVANSLVRHLAWEQPLIEAINAPHISNRYGDMDIEKGAWSNEDISDFENLGYKVNQRDLNSGLHAVQITKDLLKGAADKRREGSANAR